MGYIAFLRMIVNFFFGGLTPAAKPLDSLEKRRESDSKKTASKPKNGGAIFGWEAIGQAEPLPDVRRLSMTHIGSAPSEA
jgi:hypothetical protein